MKIIHIDSGRDWRGGQRQVYTLHNMLTNQGYDSYLICNNKGLLYQRAKMNNLSHLYGYEYISEISRKSKRQLNNIIGDINPDIIHCHDSHSLGLIDQYPPEINVFHTRRVSYPINFFSRKYKYKKANVHIAVGENIRKYIANFFENSFFIPSCIDTSRFENLKKLKSFSQNKTNLLFVGAFSKQKGIDVLIYAFKKLLTKQKNLALHLVGDGEMMKKIQLLVSENNLSSDVIFHGHKDKIEEYYISADYVIFPSIDGEGSSGVIKETFAAGKTLIASDLIDNLDLVKNNHNGFLFKNNCKDSLFKTLDKILTKNIKIDQKILKENALLYSCKKTTEKYIELYEKFYNSKS